MSTAITWAFIVPLGILVWAVTLFVVILLLGLWINAAEKAKKAKKEKKP